MMNCNSPFRLMMCLVLYLAFLNVQAGEQDDKTVVRSQQPNVWNTFPLRDVRLLPGSPFYKAMEVSQHYLLGMDVDKMLNGYRKRAGFPEKGPYPGSNQPPHTRPGYLDHYLSGISLMYAQTGNTAFKERADYIIQTLKTCKDKIGYKPLPSWNRLLQGELELKAPDEFGYPWGGMDGNSFYGIHKLLAAYRDAYLYTDNKTALQLWIDESEPIVDFVLKANPDLFDDLLDLEHGGMNEVFADLYAITGDQRYMDVSFKFNHEKVVLNIANNKDVLYGRHANMQVPTFVGTARQYQLTGDAISAKATTHFLHMIYGSHMSAIGGNSRYERFGKPGETSTRLGYTANETCNTYNMLKVALHHFESTGDLTDMDYFERALYNHILASQDPNSGGVTYYTSLMAGGFKSFSKGYDLEGVWCCVGTGMENHSKYGEAIYFHNDQDVYVNLFIPSVLQWKQKGLSLKMETNYPANNEINLTVVDNNSFQGKLYFRLPHWAKQAMTVSINHQKQATQVENGYVRVDANYKKGDLITIEMPCNYWLESAKDDPNLVAVFYGPLLLAGELGAERMPGSDLVRQAHTTYREWVPPVDDIPTLVVNKMNLNGWLKQDRQKPLHFNTVQAGYLNGKQKEVSFIPYYQMRHQRYNVYWKMYSTDELAYRKEVVSDEVNPADPASETAHHLKGEGDDTTRFNDERNFWENNRIGRIVKNGGWFSYEMTIHPAQQQQYLAVTYWGGAAPHTVFDIWVDDVRIKTADISNRYPLTYYNVTYPIPQELTQGKKHITVKFQATSGHRAGAVYALKTTTDPSAFPGYSFY